MEETKDSNYSLCLEIIDHIKTTYRWFNEGRDPFARIGIGSDPEDLDDTSTQYVLILFPSEEEHHKMSLEEFVELSPEIKSFEIINPGLIRTKNRRYYIVSSNVTNNKYLLKKLYNLKTILKEGIELDVVKDSFFVGLAATKLEIYNGFWVISSPYLAVEVRYTYSNAPLSHEQELNIVNSYIFEIADSTGVALNLSEISVPLFDYEDHDGESENEEDLIGHVEKVKCIEPYNEGMRLFVSAIQIQEAELKFLNFYKILEHFAPVVVSIEAHELMREKLKVAKRNFENGDYIKSVFDLAESVRSRFKDEELIKSTFNVCFNLIDHFEDLPESIKRKVYSAIGEKQLNSSTEPQKLKVASNMVGKIIYNTRNKVVHAKSNFRPSENICDGSDLVDLNIFMKGVCSNAIRWYNKQPQHLKLAIVN
ncbi:hypothetical protein [Pontibacter russatus]|uniref:hypothetical protein n=1 Tax=Pontibacter russatus TaxID=2694929 RepID=UPI00137A1894|nr:hypothetical protein [Pontibacter russatus]